MPVSHSKNLEYFYTPKEDVLNDKIIVRNDDFKHITKVMRKNVSDNLYITDGLGNIYITVIKKIKKDQLECEIIEKEECDSEYRTEIWLALGLLKNPSRFDFAVEKSTELGIRKIIPFESEYTIAQKAKTERLRNIAVSAMKQSLRGILPEITECIQFTELLKIKSDLKILTDISGKRKINFEPESLKSILIVVGPEGGFSDKELSDALEYNFYFLKLGNTRLRSETAAITAVSRISGYLT